MRYNAPGLGARSRWPVLPCPSMAGFEVSTEDLSSHGTPPCVWTGYSDEEISTAVLATYLAGAKTRWLRSGLVPLLLGGA